jgi:hypothetical protein
MADLHENDLCGQQQLNLLSVQDGLSAETLALLLQFQEFDSFPPQEREEATTEAAVIPDDQETARGRWRPGQQPETDHASYPTVVDPIAETYKRLQQKDDNRAIANERRFFCESQRVSDLLAYNDGNENTTAAEALQRDGVVRINQVISHELCAALLAEINRGLAQANDAVEFGNVFCREQRNDMYLRPHGLVQEALQDLLEKRSPLGELFNDLTKGRAGIFHELAALMTDPGADAQPIHPDAKYSPQCPIWTAFVALQDVRMDMGPTIMLPGSHTAAAHEQYTESAASKQQQMEEAHFVRSVLRAGDVAVMDSRCLHFGSANTSQTRRVLFYMTVRNPAHEGAYPNGGSIYDDICVDTSEYYQ